MRARSRARAWALQILYAWEMRGEKTPLLDLLAEFTSDRRIAETSRAYLSRLVQTVSENIGRIDHELGLALTNWRLERLAAIDRNILRIGGAELLFVDDVPPRVTIQEAIGLAEKYGTADSPRFVNGVLDAVMRRTTNAHGEVS